MNRVGKFYVNPYVRAVKSQLVHGKTMERHKDKIYDYIVYYTRIKIYTNNKILGNHIPKYYTVFEVFVWLFHKQHF